MMGRITRVGFLLLVLLLAVAQNAAAAISFVGSAVGSSSPATATTITLPTLVANDLIIIAAAVGDTANNGIPAPTGYTRVPGVAATLYSNDVADTNLDLYYKIAVAGDSGATVTLTATGGTNASNAGVAMVFRGVDTTTPFDVNATTATGIDTSAADPPSINHLNPTGLWVVIAASTGHTGGATATFTFPANYTTNAAQRAHNDTTDVLVGVGYRTNPGDPEDPAAFSAANIGTATDNAWAAVTMALRPVPPSSTFPVVAAVNGSAENLGETTHNVPLPTGIASGNVLIVKFVSDPATITWPAGWTNILETGTNPTVSIRFRIADGGEGASINITTAAASFHAASSFRITGAHASQAPEGASATATTSSWDAPSLTPTWGAADTLWLASEHLGSANETGTSATPTNYTSQNRQASFNGALNHTFSRDLNATSEDPPAAAHNDLAGQTWIATTIAVRPAAAGAAAPPQRSLLGVGQ